MFLNMNTKIVFEVECYYTSIQMSNCMRHLRSKVLIEPYNYINIFQLIQNLEIINYSKI